jgi:uncharacterized membrane protein
MQGGLVRMTLSQRNIRLVASLEQSERAKRSATESIIDGLATWSGQPSFPLIHGAWFGIWIAYNLLATQPFDPYPFTFLTMVVSLEAILLASFVLAAQNRMTREADRRAQLDLQLDMLAEQEVTAILRSLDALARHSGVDLAQTVPEMPELLSDTRVDRLANALAGQDRALNEKPPRR